jgi:hypothetical protein
VDYQPISDPAQLQLLQHLLRVVLHGVLLSIGLASVCLLGLCVAELRLSRCRPSDGKGCERGTSADALPALGRREAGSFGVPRLPPAGGLVLKGDIR